MPAMYPLRAIIQHPIPHTDSLNIQQPDVWSEGDTDIPCRYRYSMGGKLIDDAQRGVVRTEQVVYFPPTVQINEGDRIAEIRDRSGALLISDMDVLNVYAPIQGAGRAHHLEVRTRVIRAVGAL